MSQNKDPQEERREQWNRYLKEIKSMGNDLVTGMELLEIRCEELEAENKELRAENAKLKKQLEGE